MRKIEIEAYADTSQPDQGRVALLLHGLKAFARVPLLRLRPVDPEIVTDGEGQWPEGDLLPCEARVLEDGVELILGPEIVQSPSLLPGTAVEIEFPELRLCGEVLWPSVAPAARPRRRSIVAKRATPAPRQQLAAPRDRLAVEPAPETAALSSANPQRSMAQRPEATRPEPHPAASSLRPTQPARPHPRGAVASRTGTPDESDDRSLAAWEPPLAPKPQPEPTIADNIAWQPQVTRAKASLPSTAQTSEPSSGQPIPGAAEIAAAARRPAALPLSARGLLGLVVATVLAIEGLLFAVKGYLPTSAGADTSAGKPARTSAASATAGMADARLFDTLQTAAASPRGVATKENNPEKLLAIADAHLHGSSGVRDVEEGAYWLRRYVAASLGEERMLRALTQLGSTYAEPVSGAPDYIRARQLWEFASQFGDPVAMCFLGALHEHGLGVQPEKKAALHWYARAKSAGGCPQLEESIARVMP